MMSSSKVTIERTLCVESQEDRDALWCIYDEAFRSVNEETPIAQSFPMEQFEAFLVSEDVIKFVARLGDAIVGILLLTTDLSLEPMLSLPYFRKHHSDRTIYYVLGVAVERNVSTLSVASRLLNRFRRDLLSSADALFIFSEGVNGAISRLAIRAAGRGLREEVALDSEIVMLSRCRCS